MSASSHAPTSLFDLFRGTHWTLLLLDGMGHTADGYTRLSAIAGRVTTLLGGEIRAYIVVSRNEVPADLSGGSILLNPAHTVHRTYGAGAESLYLIWPDGYVGFCSQPVREEALTQYLQSIFRLSAQPLIVRDVAITQHA